MLNRLNSNLIYSKVSSNILSALVEYADSDWTRENDRKSTSRYIFKLYGNCIVWKSKKQTTVAHLVLLKLR